MNLIESKLNKKIIVNFKFKGFHPYLFKFIFPKIIEKLNYIGINDYSIVSLPIKNQRFTVLRSPHVDKKSREHFEMRSYSKLLKVSFNFNNNFDKQKAKLLINFIKNSASGLSLKITFKL
jgi:small subunit ribosomal protein S10